MSTPEQRREDARLMAVRAEEAAQNEAAKAQVIIDAFVAEMNARGIAPEPLRAHLLDGGEAKTTQVGWYLNAARSIAIGPAGEYFHLVVPGGVLARFRGVNVAPTLPSLTVAKGGRDGESGDLKDFLARAIGNYS
jgi:hypothetical protein